MKNFKDREFSLLNYMCDILFEFYEKNGLEHCCALESRIGGNYNTDEQLEWLERFGDVWDKVEQREVARSAA
jgi:hypothetical protein|tara:strand:- start:92 stop:307 length:216 start_codon:yes stop_codon:yes gene_type:complete